MTLTGKVISGIIETSLLSGGVIGSYYAFNSSQTISERLQNEGFELLDFSKIKGDWDIVLAAYKVAKTNIFNGVDSTTEDENGLKSKCKVVLNSKSDNSLNYGLTKQWCVKERTSSDIFEKLNLRILKPEATGSTENSDDKYWTEKAENYNNNRFNNSIEITPKPNQNTVDKEGIKNSCKAFKISDLKTTTDKFNEIIEKAKEWCTVNKDAK